MNGADNSDVFVVDASAVGDLKLADLIVDFAPQAETVDLTGLMGTLLEGSGSHPGVLSASPPETVTEMAQPVTNVGENVVDIASLSGVGHIITILYDETPTI